MQRVNQRQRRHFGTQLQPIFPVDGWSTDLTQMPFFTRAEIKLHFATPGKNVDPISKNHSVPSSVRKATTFLNDEHLEGFICSKR